MKLSSITPPLPQQHNSTDAKGNKAAQETAAQSAKPQDPGQTALQIINKTLTSAYDKISSHGRAGVADYTSFEPLTAEKVASNILGFIERRLQMDAADGASKEQLQSRLEAGLSGFHKGFAEAAEQLKALSLLSPEIEADVAKTKDLVLKGIDQLRLKFIETQSGNIQKSSTEPSADTQKTLKIPKSVALPENNGEGLARYEYGRAREFSFQLTTQEGDRVTIRASSSEGFAFETGGNNGKSAQGSYSASQSMSWQVQGNLNDDEVSAINDLLNNVDKLAAQFFDGDLDTAFEKAKNLGYDDAQIGSFSLNLAQAEVQQVTQTYKTFEAPPENNSTPLLSEQLLPLGNFIRDLLESVKLASLFPEPLHTLSDAAKNITAGDDAEKQGLRLQAFIEKIGTLMTQKADA